MEYFAQRQRPGVQFHVEWKPFQIDPNTNIKGEEMEAYCRRRWGSSSWTHQLRNEGRKSGANFSNWKWWPNTSLAHQWIQYGIELEGADRVDTHALNEILFQALYENGQNISDLETLVQLAYEHCPSWHVNPNNPNDPLRHYLAQQQGVTAVQQDIRNGRRDYRISSVPYFIIGIEREVEGDDDDDDDTNVPYGLSGAQSVSTFVTVFEKLVHHQLGRKHDK